MGPSDELWAFLAAVTENGGPLMLAIGEFHLLDKPVKFELIRRECVAYMILAYQL